MTILCKTVNVEFAKQGKQRQEIRATQLTACHILAVTANEHFVSITYMSMPSQVNPTGQPLKIICLSKNELLEFSCEDSVSVVEDKK